MAAVLDFEAAQGLLRSPQFARALEVASDLIAPRALDRAAAMLRLKRLLPGEKPHVLGLALETAEGRRWLASESDWSRHGIFTSAGIEQRSAAPISRHHAARFRGCAEVLEIGTGLGFDCAAIARQAKKVVTIEADPLVAAAAKHNLALQGFSNVEIIAAEGLTAARQLDLSRFDGSWCDPARRGSGGRISNPADYRPPLPEVLAFAGGKIQGIKISPGLNADFDLGEWTREFIGFRDECREQILWRGAAVADRTATLVDAGVSWSQRAGQDQAPVLERLPHKGEFIVEPHAALIRTQALEFHFFECGFARLDSRIAYAVATAKPPASPWYESFEVIEAIPYNVRRLRRALRDHGWDGVLEIKKRGFALSPEELRGAIKQRTDSKGQSGTIIATRQGDSPIVILCRRSAKNG